MVRVRQTKDEDELGTLVEQLCEKHGYRFYVDGWARKTYDVFSATGRAIRDHLVRVESLAMTSGEVHLYADEAEPFAMELAAELEQLFGIEEAVIVRDDAPEY